MNNLIAERELSIVFNLLLQQLTGYNSFIEKFKEKYPSDCKNEPNEISTQIFVLERGAIFTASNNDVCVRRYLFFPSDVDIIIDPNEGTLKFMAKEFYYKLLRKYPELEL
jgi:hypothetical protein